MIKLKSKLKTNIYFIKILFNHFKLINFFLQYIIYDNDFNWKAK